MHRSHSLQDLNHCNRYDVKLVTMSVSVRTSWFWDRESDVGSTASSCVTVICSQCSYLGCLRELLLFIFWNLHIIWSKERRLGLISVCGSKWKYVWWWDDCNCMIFNHNLFVIQTWSQINEYYVFRKFHLGRSRFRRLMITMMSWSQDPFTIRPLKRTWASWQSIINYLSYQ